MQEMVPCNNSQQGSYTPLADLARQGAISVTTSVHAVQNLRSPSSNLRMKAPQAAKVHCALQPLAVTLTQAPGYYLSGKKDIGR
jgi:hypothetical protein